MKSKIKKSGKKNTIVEKIKTASVQSTKMVEVKDEGYAIDPVELMEVVDEFNNLQKKLKSTYPNLDLNEIRRAHRFAAFAHRGQRRGSGRPFIFHGIEVASIIADLHLDTTSVMAGLLHDVCEDTSITVKEVRGDFGDEIANIVEGLTNISDLALKSSEAQQSINFRRMILSMIKDVRVMMVKFADRLHNMRTLEFLNPATRYRIAKETLEVYAPLAHRFGVNLIQRELEDLSLRWLEPEVYRKIHSELQKTMDRHERIIREIVKPLKSAMKKNSIKAEVEGRVKSINSIFKKVQAQKKPLNEIYDILAIRILVDTVTDCYHALGVIHSMYIPRENRLKDFISTPKSNIYQSLHTTVIGLHERPVEIQIRTHEMHRTAEAGIAAHWRYKEGKIRDVELDKHMEWLRKVVKGISDSPDDEFLETFKMDLFSDEIFIFTPKGDIVRLPAGATPIDFAFALHTEIGLQCHMAKVDGRITPLSKPLKSGSEVEIQVHPSKKPSTDWLHIVKTGKAKSKIRRWIRQEEYNQSLAIGREIFDRFIKKHKYHPAQEELQNYARKRGRKSVEDLYAAVGAGNISIESIEKSLFKHEPRKTPITRIKDLFDRKAAQPSGAVRIQNVDNLMITFARCCRPLPGDAITGYITRGRGITVHRVDCPSLARLDVARRTIEVKWETIKDITMEAEICIIASDRPNIIFDIVSKINEIGINIRDARVKKQHGTTEAFLKIEVANTGHLNEVISAVENIRDVLEVKRKSRELRRKSKKE